MENNCDDLEVLFVVMSNTDYRFQIHHLSDMVSWIQGDAVFECE